MYGGWSWYWRARTKGVGGKLHVAGALAEYFKLYSVFSFERNVVGGVGAQVQIAQPPSPHHLAPARGEVRPPLTPRLL